MNSSLSAEKLSNLLSRLWRQLSRRRQRQFGLLLGLMLISAFAEVISLGAVLPFLAILTAPDVVFERPVVAMMAKSWGLRTADQLVLPLTVAFAMAALMAGVVRMLLLWMNTRLAFVCGADLSAEVYRRTLYQPYEVHVGRNTSEVISGITSKVGGAVAVLYQMLTLTSSVFLLVAIVAALIVIDPTIAFLAAIGFGVSYALISRFTRQRLRRNSQRIAVEETRVVKALQEGLGAIRDVLLDGAQSIYCNEYRQADRPLRHARGDNIFIGGSPRFAMEALGMVLIATLAYGLSRQPGGIASTLPVLGALALGAQRLLPALQQAYNSWANIVGNHSSLADALALLEQPLLPEVMQPAPPPWKFQDAIRFEAVSFRYSPDAPWILDGLNLEIRKGERLGFVGRTGGGKSTMLDMLMGLLPATKGQIAVDGKVLDASHMRAWRQAIAHVPQSIYLADKTLAENIAFSVPPELIDMQRVRQAAQQAQIADFIERQPKGYNALVGERGVRLSGGQRQRIGIARALYKRASVLVLDEATSALDSATEAAVMEAISELDRSLTILIIAHRVTTLQRCDTIIELENGRIVAQGTYEELLESSASFRQLAAQNA